MAIRQMHHVGIVVDDMPAAVAFFGALGLEPEGDGQVGGDTVDRIVGLEGVQAEIAMMRTPDGHGRLELVRFRSPWCVGGDGRAPSNARGIRHIAFVVDDLDAAVAGLRAHGGELVGGVEQYGGTYRLCYLRGPAGIIVELAEKTG